MTAAIEVAGLNKSFGGRPVVRDFSIRVEAGRICGFLGPNGSGKTTTIRMLCGLLTPDSGTGTCLGLDIIRLFGSRPVTLYAPGFALAWHSATRTTGATP